MTLMATISHTPGPWQAYDYEQYVTARLQPHRDGICEMLYVPDEPGLNREVAANARLIAAAPTLLAACQAVIEYHANPAAAEETAYNATAGNVTALDALLGQVVGALADATGDSNE